MGCGKTTVAQELALKLNLPWVDLDALIKKHERRSPEEIIEQDGEAKFRERETWMLRKVLSSGAERVIAVGGGAWTIPENRQLIADHQALAVWLDAPFELCWKRLKTADQIRPLAPTRQAAHRLYADRQPVYSSADFQIPLYEEESPEEIAKKIAAVLRYKEHS